MTPMEASRLTSFGLVVLIWLVQAIIYPAFLAIDPARFPAWHGAYTRAITWIVGPLMLGQAASLGWLLASRPAWPYALAALAVAAAWAATILLAIPAHEQLGATGLDRAVASRLIATNWIRTVAWSLAFLCLLA